MTDLFNRARGILERNDHGGFTVPTEGLYPFQWNWDSGFAALGFSHFDLDRAFVELETLMAHQWPDGMVPHIIFHEEDDGYFPNTDVWQTARPTPTSGITQPPVAGFILKTLVERAGPEFTQRARDLVERLHRWHQWFYSVRGEDGLVAIVHPWESGRDNSVDWDEAFERVPTQGVAPFERRDVQHADPAHRPTDAQYQRYIWLVQQFRELGWDNLAIARESAFQVVDPGFNAILIRSCLAISALSKTLGLDAIAAESAALAAEGTEALERLWHPHLHQYVCFDRVTAQLVENASIGGLLPIIVDLPARHAQWISETIAQQLDRSRYSLASQPVYSDEFDALRYWRGPIWLIVNHMIATGLREHGQGLLASRIEMDSLALIEESGFAEYYGPHGGEPCGGDTFTWTAAIVLELLAAKSEVA